ncbi:MAG: SDR family oxidoreductase, partial [Myxococcota bacterium]
EIGRNGSTANLIHVSEGAEGRLEAVLRFVLSSRSAFISGQEITVGHAVKAAQPRWVRPLEGKVALITGAARGIGAATARAMTAEGATVLVLDRPADDGPASKVARELGAPAPLLFDITDPETPAALVEALKAHGGADIVIHNAGITRDKTLGRMKPDWWDLALDVNLGAVVRTTHAILEGGALNDHGRIICLTSIAGLAGNVGQTNYATAKAGLVEFVRRLGQELAPRGATANAIAPGFIETRMTAAIPPVTREAGRRLASLSQGGLPEDVANALTFLASPGADGINGQVLRVCGGSFLGA